jgi:hypothetical protein
MNGGSPSVLWSGAQLLGREGERQVLDRLLDGVRGGHGGVLVMDGEAGVGCPNPPSVPRHGDGISD